MQLSLTSGVFAALLAWPEAGSAAPAWAVLINLLVAYLIAERNAPSPASGEGVRLSGLTGAFLIISGVLLALAGVVLCLLAGPGLPLLAIGCPLLTFGLIANIQGRNRRKR